MATHSVQPVAMSVSVSVWTKSPSIFGPPQCSTMSISKKPGAGSRQSVYLVAVLDWASRRVLAHRVSITIEADFCVEALQEAAARWGAPEIVNTDRGSQFSSADFV